MIGESVFILRHGVVLLEAIRFTFEIIFMKNGVDFSRHPSKIQSVLPANHLIFIFIFFLHYKLFNQLIWDGWLPHKLNLLSLALHSARSVCPAHAVARSVSWGYLGAGNHLGD